MRRLVIHNHFATRDARKPYDPANREYTGREPVAAAIKNHPGVQEVEISRDSTYKYEVFLKEGWVFETGRMAGIRTGFFQNVREFRQANPVRKSTAEDATETPRHLQHFTLTRNIESIRQNGLQPRGHGLVYAEKAKDPPGPHKEHVHHSVVRIDTKHPALKNHKFARGKHYEGYEYTTSKTIPPEALKF